jgi:hypothetical protein
MSLALETRDGLLILTSDSGSAASGGSTCYSSDTNWGEGSSHNRLRSRYESVNSADPNSLADGEAACHHDRYQ